jgi:hypothetical protein
MFKLTLVALFTLMISSSTVFAGGGGGGGGNKCKPDNVAGSYTRADPNTDVFANGTLVAHTFLYQLNLHSDGTADQYWTGFPDYIMELGTASPWIGSWKCRNDGKLVVTVIRALYNPIPPSPACVFPCVPVPDIELSGHVRSTYLFSVENSNTLKRVQSRARVYFVTDDPSDPTAGTLFPKSFTEDVYKRLKASDADLLLP